MIESIAISRVATYDNQFVVLGGLSKYNFILAAAYTNGILILGITSLLVA